MTILSKSKDEIAQMENRNRWDIFKILIIEPSTNLNDILIDVMIANLTSNYETILSNANCNTETRRKPPKFTQRRRVLRGIFEGLFKKLAKRTGKFLGWAAVLTTAGAVGSNTAVWLDHYLTRQDYIFLEEQELSCKSYNFGCHEHLCYANCGPRRASADWCYTRTLGANSTHMTPFGLVQNANLCNYDRDCSPCTECASECFRDDVDEIVNNKN